MKKKVKIKKSNAVLQKIKVDIQQRDPDPKIRQEKKEKATKVLQSAVNKKTAENKAALEMIKRRQEAARKKHVGARERATKISEMRKQLKSLEQDIKIEEVMALVREENKDIEEAIVAIAPTPELAAGGAAQHEAGHNASVLREAAAAAPGYTAAAMARSVISVEPQTPRSPERNVLEPSAILAVMLSPEIVNPPLNTSLEVAEEQISIVQQEATFLEESEASAIPKLQSLTSVKNQASAKSQVSSCASVKGQESIKLSPEEQREKDLYCGIVNVFGGEREMSAYMEDMGDRVRAWLADVTADSMLLDVSDIENPDRLFEEAQQHRAGAAGFRDLIERPSVVKVQLRGSQPPDWFPGYWTVIPPPKWLLARSPSRCLAAAWRHCRPDDRTDTDAVV